MTLTRKHKLTIALAVSSLFFAVASWEGAKFWWFRDYSHGTRTGIVRKISVKGPPYCKYVSAELALQAGAPGQVPEIWEFSVDGEDEKSKLYLQLQQAERAAQLVTIVYRQDLHSMWR